MRRMTLRVLAFLLLLLSAAEAGPPYVSDDPEPTDDGHYEIYLFDQGTSAQRGVNGAFGVDFNYGAAPDLQLTAVLPLAYAHESAGSDLVGIGNVELAAKYRFLHQGEGGWDAAFFPRVLLPSASALVGEKHVSLLLPLWLEHDWGKWSTFGGGGCTLGHGGDSQDFCLAGWALTRQVLPALQLGIEVVHQTADTKGGRADTALGGGLRCDLSETYHLLASAGPKLQNAAETGRMSWYASLLVTF
jgi:outer membrane putative beta-barrel porin/alpha-amylase